MVRRSVRRIFLLDAGKLGQIVFLVLDMEAGFPRARGVLTLDESALGPVLYKSPREAKLNPLGADNIDDPIRIMN